MMWYERRFRGVPIKFRRDGEEMAVAASIMDSLEAIGWLKTIPRGEVDLPAVLVIRPPFYLNLKEVR